MYEAPRKANLLVPMILGVMLGCTSPTSSTVAMSDRQTTATKATPTMIDQVGGRAAQIFRQRCVSCHGIRGDGLGVAARSLPVKPRSFLDPNWRASVTDEHLATVIVRGGAAVGLHPLMSANPDLKNQPAVIKGLIEIIRGL